MDFIFAHQLNKEEIHFHEDWKAFSLLLGDIRWKNKKEQVARNKSKSWYQKFFSFYTCVLHNILLEQIQWKWAPYIASWFFNSVFLFRWVAWRFLGNFTEICFQFHLIFEICVKKILGSNADSQYFGIIAATLKFQWKRIKNSIFLMDRAPFQSTFKFGNESSPLNPLI